MSLLMKTGKEDDNAFLVDMHDRENLFEEDVIKLRDRKNFKIKGSGCPKRR